MSTLIIKRFQKGQEEVVSMLIRKVYDEFVAVDYSVAGNQFFYSWVQPATIATRQQKQINIWLAFFGSELVGMIEIRDNKYISLLFVDKQFQGKGIAKRLFSKALKEIKARDPGINRIYVHASPFSVPIYRKMGFIETGSMQEENGIRYLPMEMII